MRAVISLPFDFEGTVEVVLPLVDHVGDAIEFRPGITRSSPHLHRDHRYGREMRSFEGDRVGDEEKRTITVGS